MHGYIDILLMNSRELLKDKVSVELNSEHVVYFFISRVLDHDEEFVTEYDLFSLLFEIDTDGFARGDGFTENTLEEDGLAIAHFDDHLQLWCLFGICSLDIDIGSVVDFDGLQEEGVRVDELRVCVIVHQVFEKTMVVFVGGGDAAFLVLQVHLQTFVHVNYCFTDVLHLDCSCLEDVGG